MSKLKKKDEISNSKPTNLDLYEALLYLEQQLDKISKRVDKAEQRAA